MNKWVWYFEEGNSSLIIDLDDIRGLVIGVLVIIIYSWACRNLREIKAEEKEIEDFLK